MILYPTVFIAICCTVDLFISPLTSTHSLRFHLFLFLVCCCCSDEFLVIARKSGVITRYSLPHLNIENTYIVHTEPYRYSLNFRLFVNFCSTTPIPLPILFCCFSISLLYFFPISFFKVNSFLIFCVIVESHN